VFEFDLTEKEYNKFIKKVHIDSIDGCWNWLGGKESTGYGMFFVKSKNRYAHKISFNLFVHKISLNDKIVRSGCKNKSCVNPKHLKLFSNEKICSKCDAVTKNLTKNLCYHCYNKYRYAIRGARKSVCHPKRSVYNKDLCRECYIDSSKTIPRATCHVDKGVYAHNLCFNCYPKSLKFKEQKKILYLKYSYSMTLDRYEEMLKTQNGQCLICSDPVNCIDHDHRTGIVRGLLCKVCNSGLGYFRDSIEYLENAITYLKQHNFSDEHTEEEYLENMEWYNKSFRK
jgi:hypothetical protein